MDVRCMNCFQVFDNQYDRCPHCGYSDGEPPKELYHLYPGTELLGRYVIGEVLGFGGFGITYKAWDKKFETILAIKEYYPCGIVNRVPGTSEVILFTGKKKDIFVNGLERFLDEAKNMAKFSQNNNIVNVFEYFEDNNTGYIVMELLEGISLNNYLMKQTRKLPMDEIMNITMSVCSALKDLHEIGIIHRDVSPDNIYMCSNGKIKLIDFGAARFSLNEEKKMTIILKPGFAPPEQYEKINKQGPWTDIYALGATVYLLLTGSKPDESTNRKVRDTVEKPRDLDPDIPEHISNTIMKAISLDRKKRFNSVDKFESALTRKTKVKEQGGNPEEQQGKLVSTIVVAIALVLGIIFSAYSILGNREVQLKNAQVSVWICSEDDAEKTVKEAAMRQIITEFKKKQPNVSVNVTSYLRTEYDANIITALNSSSVPDIFESTNLKSDKLNNVLSANELYDEIGKNKFLMQKYIKDNKELSNKVPMGFDIPVFYVNKSLDEYKEDVVTKLGDFGTMDSINNKIGMELASANLYKSVFENDELKATKYIVNNARTLFATDKLAYYFGTTKEYYAIQDLMSGNGVYKIVYIDNGTLNVRYKDCFSVSNKNKDKNQEKAIIEFYKYMYSDKGQDIMYISNQNKAIPLNKVAYESYCSINTEMDSILDSITVLK
ncbi:MAG: extracellular solute-binding protein [Lachnospiraceae bacterium]|nr:extracellular solute-binding protein [Lachnospiraceae bacterium]